LDNNETLAIWPWHALTLPWSIERLHLVAKGHSNKIKDEKQDKPFHNFFPTSSQSNTRIKIAYLSGDFYDHPISHLLHGLFGKHNRDKVEVFVYSFTPPNSSSYRLRIENESEHFIDVPGMNVKEIAKRIASDGIQILIDIMGYTGFSRGGVYPLRPAPIQVNFLGMLGTMGADFFDYIITDEFLTPPDYANNFNEKFVYMPHSYMIAELEKEVPFKKVDRAIYGLPDKGFVFCSFNNSYKIEPLSFDLWMEILKQVPESVLWLQSTGPIMEKNIRAETEKRGVNGSRVHFAGFVPREVHLHRHLAADLFLDSLVYNAAATSSLALQMGLPVLTCSGKTFASRVCGSLLRAVELPDLIAKDYDEFITLAISLANNPDKLQFYSQNLIKNRSRLPLFDTARFAGYLEKAYAMMWANYTKGNSPAVIKVQE